MTVSDDSNRNRMVIYTLAGQGVEGTSNKNPSSKNKFAINSTSGEIYALRPLDRDLPHGRSQWKLTVFAEEAKTRIIVGYADVLINLRE